MKQIIKLIWVQISNHPVLFALLMIILSLTQNLVGQLLSCESIDPYLSMQVCADGSPIPLIYKYVSASVISISVALSTFLLLSKTRSLD